MPLARTLTRTLALTQPLALSLPLALALALTLSLSLPLALSLNSAPHSKRPLRCSRGSPCDLVPMGRIRAVSAAGFATTPARRKSRSGHDKKPRIGIQIAFVTTRDGFFVRAEHVTRKWIRHAATLGPEQKSAIDRHCHWRCYSMLILLALTNSAVAGWSLCSSSSRVPEAAISPRWRKLR